MQPSFTAPWIIQRLQEDPLERSLSTLAAWTHHKRQLEVNAETIHEINELSTEDALTAVNELRCSKSYIQGTGGTKLQMRVILTLKDDRSLETTALLDSGSTGSCINRRFVEENQIQTRKLPR